ncbi:MAG: amidohydrolase [Clostridia bacterium]|nr:amidohydrolase [Clostridia bacterium]
MDLILFNGLIHTMLSESNVVSAVAIKDKKIFSVGNDDAILQLKTENTQLIDLKKQHVFPGFNDSHMHLMGYGAALMQIDLSSAKSISDVIDLSKAFIEENNIPKNSWVLGRGWNQDYFTNREMPTYEALDQISTEHFIFLRRTCGHVATVNSKVLNTFNLKKEFTSIDGGEYYDGIFKENALELILREIPEPTLEDIQAWIIKGMHTLFSMGITSVQSDDLCVFPENMNEMVFDAFKDLAEKNLLKIKVYEQSLFRTKDNLEKFIQWGYKQDYSIGNFKYGPLKILGDGSLGGRTAYLSQSYADANTKGISMYTEEELTTYITFAQKHNIASAIHCIGDAMLDMALNAIEKAQQSYPNPNLKHGIVHCQITRPEQIEKLKALNIMTYVQPIFLDYDIHIVHDRVGEKLAESSYAWKTMSKLGIHMSFGSDAPVETPNPLKGIHCAVTRQDLKNRPKEKYLPHEAISIYEGFYHYTVEGAYASNNPNKGMILKSYEADLVVVSGNVMENPLDGRVEITIVNGEVVYER